jgi:tripartite-type tricarboxylate transporter receptor subunit TctC
MVQAPAREGRRRHRDGRSAREAHLRIEAAKPTGEAAMKILRVLRVLRAILGLALAAFGAQAFSQAYPNKPVRLVITFPPGSATDIVGRIMSLKLTEVWAQPVIVENRGGAGGSIGSAVVAKAAPDGYTLLMNSSAHAANPSMYARMPYDTLKDFTDIGFIAGQPNVLVESAGSGIKSLSELLAHARANPGKVNFASAGVGSGTHLNLEKFLLATGIKVTHIPYKGSQEAFGDLLGGRVDYYFAPISPAIPLVKEGKLRALAVSSAKRSSQLPDLPTMAEAGVPGFEFTLWFGLWGPAGMQQDVVDKASRDLNTALSNADARERLGKLGSDYTYMSPQDFGQFVRREIADYARVIQAAGIQPQ